MSDTTTAASADTSSDTGSADPNVDAGTAPAADAADAQTGDESSDPQGSQADDPKLKAARDEAAANRVKAREANEAREAAEQAAQQANDILGRLQKALGGDDDSNDGEADPSEQVVELTTERDTLRAEVAELRRNDVVRAQAGDEYDAQALLDSRAFTDAVGKLDQSADDYAAQVADAIKAAAENTPRFRVGQVPARGGAPIPGGSGEGSTTQAEFDAMSYRERVSLKQADPTLYARLSGAA